MRYYLEPNGDYLMVRDRPHAYDYAYPVPKAIFEGRAAAIAGLPTSVCTCAMSGLYLAECRRVLRRYVPAEWLAEF